MGQSSRVSGSSMTQAQDACWGRSRSQSWLKSRLPTDHRVHFGMDLPVAPGFCEQPVCRCWAEAPYDWSLSVSPSCYEVNLRGCLLQDLFVSFSRPPGSQKEENFICRLGELQVRHPRDLAGAWPRHLCPLQTRPDTHPPPPLAQRGAGKGVPGLGLCRARRPSTFSRLLG